MGSGIGTRLSRADPLTRDLLAAGALWVACVAAREISFASLVIPGVERMALLWLPTVFLLVALLLSPWRRWWMLVAASVLAALATAGEAGPVVALVMESMNSGQALAAAAALRALGFLPRDVVRFHGLVLFLGIAGFLAPLVFSIASAALLGAGGWVRDIQTNWQARTITNILTALTIGPPLLIGLARPRLPPPSRLVEGAALVAAIPVVEILVTRGTTDVLGVAAALLYLPVLFFLWAALRLGPAGVSLAALAVLATRVYLGTPVVAGVLEVGPADALLALQLFVISMATPFAFIAATIRDYRRAEDEIRSSARRHRMATDAGRVGAWDWDLVGDRIYLDPSLKALIGYADHEIGDAMQEWGEHVHPGDRDRIAAAVEGHLERGEPFEVEHRMLHKDGTVRWFIARGSVIERDEDGRPTRMIGTDVDVTERRHIEDAVDALRSSLQASERAEGMGTFAAEVAHEVSQPLSAILANAQACVRWLGTERPDLDLVREALRDIVGAGEVAGDVIDRTRAMFRRRKLDHEAVSVPDVVRVSLDVMRRRLQAADVRVTVDCPAGLPAVLGDAVQLQQVLDNLITNAVEAMERAEPPRRLAIVAAAADDFVRLTVTDTGRGIPERDRTRIFEPFVSTRSDGLGLGLAISRSILTAHGGSIRADAGEDGGADFELLVPVARTAEPSEGG